MAVSVLLQYLVLAGLLAWSVFFVLRRLMPVPLRHMQGRLAAAAAGSGWHRLASWLQPGTVQKGCDSGCSSCGTGCGEDGQDTPIVQLRKSGPVSEPHQH